jgi:hypothetical protein
MSRAQIGLTKPCGDPSRKLKTQCHSERSEVLRAIARS